MRALCRFTRTAKALWVAVSSALVIGSVGCSGVRSAAGPGPTPNGLNGSCKLRFSSHGGYRDLQVEVDFDRSRDNPFLVMVKSGTDPAVQREYGADSVVAKNVEQIVGSGVFDLPAEKKKRQRAGSDLARLRMEYQDRDSGVVVTRDYHWAKHFEPRFHKAEQLFEEIATVVLQL